uniref:restriction endonuclease subunit S n=1 Tax=Hylemonella sp. TaxID=2066020 RepID=UPI0035B3A1AA
MRSDWPVVRLGDHCSKIGSGATPKGGKEAYLDEGPYRLIRSQNIYNEGFAWQGLAFISEEQARKLDGVSVEAGDVLVNITGDSVARVCTAPKAVLPARVNQHVAIVRPRSTSFDANFVRWFFSSPAEQKKLLGLASAGATRNALTKAMLENLQIPKPPVEVQQELVAPLVAIEERLNLLRQTKTTLESITQTLFKSWFIDFDPVRAKAEGREPEGMDAATAALFPAEFEKSAQGLVPKGWPLASVSSLAALRGGKQLSRGEFDAAAANPVFGGAGEMGRTNLFNAEGFVLTVGRVGAYCGRFFWYEGRAWVNNNASIVRPHLSHDGIWLHQMLLASDMEKIKKGAAQPFVSNGDIEALPIVVPTNALRFAFHAIAEPLYQKQTALAAHARLLEDLRDAILPRLIYGELRLPDAKSRIAEAIA